jgi:cation transport ATPase
MVKLVTPHAFRAARRARPLISENLVMALWLLWLSIIVVAFGWFVAPSAAV